MDTIFDFTNSGRTQVKYKNQGGVMTATKPAGGACFGYSLIWAANMVDGKSAKLSKPSIVGGLPLQQKVEHISANWDASIAKVVTDYGYTSTRVFDGYYRSAIRHVRDNPGWYIVDIGHHWLGMGNRGQYYYFDANEGLLETSSANDFYNHVKSDLQANYKSDAGFEKNHHKVYKITR